MAYRTISATAPAYALTGEEHLPLVQNGKLRRVGLRPVLGGRRAHKLCIYYGIPEGVNGSYDVEYAVGIFANFDTVVFGTGLEEPGNTYHASTQTIIGRLPNTEVFGYIDLSVTISNLSLATIHDKVDKWRAMGARGIFYDVAGYTYGVSRARLNDAVDYAHTQGLSVCANDASAADLFDSTVNATYNPSGTPSSLGAGDVFLLESWVMNTAAYTGTNGWNSAYNVKTNAETVLPYRASRGIRVWASGIVEYDTYTSNETDAYWDVMDALAVAYDLDAWSIGPDVYSASGATTNALRLFPYRSQHASGLPRYNGSWDTITSPGAGLTITYGAGATPAYSVAAFRGA